MAVFGISLSLWFHPDQAMQAQSTLPPGLVSYRYDAAAGDFLDRIWHNEQGEYVRWTTYPVHIYIQPNNAQWMLQVQQAVRQWTAYVPLEIVEDVSQAEITVERVPWQVSYSGKAKASFEITETGQLHHWVHIRIYRYLSLPEVGVVALHEIGHALGLWGHSLSPADLMFGGDAAATEPSWKPDFRRIGSRDLNTLKRLYEQPSVLGDVHSLLPTKNDPAFEPDRSR